MRVRRTVFLLFFAGAVSGCGAPMAASTVGSPAALKTYDATVLADRPAAYWRMDETSGTTMTDASGNHNDGVYAGAYSLGQPPPFGGVGNLAVSFDGQKGGSASVPSAPSLQMNTITIELWMKKRTDTEYGVYVAKSYFQLLNNRHTGALEFRVTSEAEPAVVSSSTLSLNTWYYVAGWRNCSSTANWTAGSPSWRHPCRPPIQRQLAGAGTGCTRTRCSMRSRSTQPPYRESRSPRTGARPLAWGKARPLSNLSLGHLTRRSERSRGGKFALKVGRLNLEERLRRRQAVELMQAQVFEADPGRPRVGHRLTNRAGQQDLAPVARKTDPSRRVDSQADVAGVGQGRPAGM